MEAEESGDTYPGNESGANSVVLPRRIDLCLPGVAYQLLPIPLERVYNVADRQLATDCFDVLNYTVQLLLDIASHLSPRERDRLGNTTFVFVHPMSGLMLHTQRSFANYAMECILTEHNSSEPLVLSPSWPSVFFDDNGYPAFCEQEQVTIPQAPIPRRATRPVNLMPATTDTSLAGEWFVKFESAPNVIEPPTDPFWKPAKYDKKKRKYIGLDAPKDEFSTLTMPRL